MNICIVSGRLTKNAVVNGDNNKVLRFRLAAKHGYDSKEKKERVEFIDCVLFKPTEKVQSFLCESGKGVYLELTGRFSSQSFEVNGEKRYRTEVIANRIVNIVSNGKS